MGTQGLAATSQWPITEEQRWTFVVQANSTYAIVNRKHDMRILAQYGKDLDDGFFAVDSSSQIYEDQRWTLQLQQDGSYAITNMRSGRRILAQSGQDGGTGFGAKHTDGAIRPEEKWWLINQEKDEAGKWLVQLESAQNKSERIGEQFKTKFGEVLSLTSELKSARKQFGQDLAASQVEAARMTHRIAVQKQVNKKLIGEVVELQAETGHMVSDLQAAKDAKAQLADDRDAALGEVRNLSAQIQVEKLAEEFLIEEVKSKESLLGRLSYLLAFAVIAASLFLPYHRHRLNTAHGKASMLAEELATTRATEKATDEAIVVLAEDNEKYLARIADLELQSSTTRVTETATDEAIVILAQDNEKYLARIDDLELQFATARVTEKSTDEAIVILAQDNEKHLAKIDDLELQLEQLGAPAEPKCELGFDFAFQVFNMDLDQSTMRLIKIQCPGVTHKDVEVSLVFNGCEVAISRRASQGVEAKTFRKQFTWKPSEGLFEFKEDQMQLESGFLHLVFKAYNFQSRVIRFPMHFNLDDTDNDRCWEFSAEGELTADEDDSPGCLALTKPGSYIDTESTASTSRRHSLV